MKKLLLAFVVVAALLTGCSEKLYEMSAVTVTEKKEPERTACRGICYKYTISIKKDGNTYTYTVDDSSYKLVEVGTVVDITVYDTSLDGNKAKLTPVGIKKE